MPRILISFILFGISLVFGVIFFWPRYQELDSLQVQIENKRQEIKNQDKYYQELSLISKELDEHQEELTKINSALSFNPPLPSLLKYLQKVAPENGLILASISSFSIQPLPERADIKEIQGSLKLSGSYPSLKNFLKTLEKSARLIEVDSVSFSVFQKKEGETVEISEIFNFSLSIRTKSY